MSTESRTTEDRIARLEEQVDLLARALDFHYEDPAAVVPPEVAALIRDGHTVQAMHRLRQLTGAGLVSSRQIVEAAAATLSAGAGA